MSSQTENYHFISHAHAKQSINPTFYKKVLTNALAVWLAVASHGVGQNESNEEAICCSPHLLSFGLENVS